MLNYYSHSSYIMDRLSPIACVLEHKTKICPSVKVTPEMIVTGTFKTYHLKLKGQFAYLRQHLQKFREQRL